MKKILILAALVVSFCTLNSQPAPLTLDSCIAIARRNNADIRTSQLELQKAQSVKRQVFTNWFPRVQLSALGYVAAKPMLSFGIDDVQSNDIRELLEAIYDAFSEETDITKNMELMKNGFSGSLTVTQPLYVGGRIANGNRLAALGVEAAQLQSEITMRDVIENIESSFYLVTGLKEKETTMASALALVDSLQRVVASALANGLVTRADALQLELKRNEITALHHKLTSGIRLARRMLCNQIGIEYSDSIEFIDPKSALPPRLDFTYSNRADSLRPEMRLLQLNVDVEQLFRKMTIGETLPQLALTGMGYYGNLVRNFSSGNAVALLTLSIPISNWWETSHKLQQHDIKIEQAQLLQQNYSSLMSLEEEKAYSDMVDAWLLIKSDSSALDIAHENYRLATLNYQAGNTTLSEVLQAHTLLLQAENALTDRRISYIVARRRLQDLKGGDF